MLEIFIAIEPVELKKFKVKTFANLLLPGLRPCIASSLVF